jgi:sugar (pentulose or hexulose) kinase
MKEVTAIFDIGKTNKKLLLFDKDFQLVLESIDRLPETLDDDGFPCEDIVVLEKWITDKWEKLLADKAFKVTALNFTSYGASLVNLDENDRPVTPLYSYLKPFPDALSEKLYYTYGGKWSFASATCTPPMGMLNSGLQLYWIKHEKPHLFKKIVCSLHLPQYLSFLFSKVKQSDYTSIGCHTALWDFENKHYHRWAVLEGISSLFPPLTSNAVAGKMIANTHEIDIGTGLHDSSSALIPYLKKFKEPFLLLSTGTWCITFNPFNHSPLTNEELSKDCLCFLSTESLPVKASRIFLGKEHENTIELLAEHFSKPLNYFDTITFNPAILRKHLETSADEKKFIPQCMEGTGPFPEKLKKGWDLNLFSKYEDAYLQLMLDLTCMLKFAIELIDSRNTEAIFVEGGFGGSDLFMNLLANHFPEKNVKASFLHQATADGAALHIKNKSEIANWNFQTYSFSDANFALNKYYLRNWQGK